MNIPAHDCSLRKRTQRKSVLLITIIARVRFAPTFRCFSHQLMS